jgi:hypothetical protein
VLVRGAWRPDQWGSGFWSPERFCLGFLISQRCMVQLVETGGVQGAAAQVGAAWRPGHWLSSFLVATRLPLSLQVCECVRLAGKQKHVAFQGASGLQGDLVSEDSAY